MAVFIGVLTFIYLPNFPDQMKQGKNWPFNKEEVKFAINRVSGIYRLLRSLPKRDSPYSLGHNTLGAKVNLKQVLTTLRDLKSWVFAFLNAGLAIGISSVGLFLASFIHEFGFSTGKTTLYFLYLGSYYSILQGLTPFCAIS
jgi:hypothetical protein